MEPDGGTGYCKSVCTNEVVAEWNHRNGSIDLKRLKQPVWTPDPRSGTPLIVSAFNCAPFFYVDEENHITGGLEYQIINAIFHKWSHVYNMLNQTESRKNLNKWTIIMETVADKSADLAGCSQWQIFMNLSKVDTTYPLTQVCVTYLVPKPKLLPHFTFLLQPFNLMSWLITLAMFSLVSTFLIGIHHVYKLFMRDLKLDTGITSSLTNPRLTTPIKTIDDMVTHNVKWLEIAHLKNSFKASKVENLQKLADLAVLDKQQDVAFGTKQLSNLYLTDIENLNDYDKNHLTVLNECFGNFYTVFVMKKRSPYTKIIDKYLGRFHEQEYQANNKK
ncbi:hypothetical protein BDFB_003754 [Asbolus verrucosus]|uniref:Uncharacterized protein n=1 Tax=Asbolus verrucosus TaxID=1661398 RepID=A0A482WCH9_ASBVE|nr:hypothetical protein BDFB_003754 [Asbolus verrucosus]